MRTRRGSVADDRVAIDLRHAGFGCRISPLCGTYATSIQERAAHELATHARVARADPPARPPRDARDVDRERDRSYMREFARFYEPKRERGAR